MARARRPADLTPLQEVGIMGLFRGPLAQLAEQLTLNQRVRGSIPRRLTSVESSRRPGDGFAQPPLWNGLLPTVEGVPEGRAGRRSPLKLSV